MIGRWVDNYTGTNTVLSTEIDTEEQAASHEKYKGQY